MEIIYKNVAIVHHTYTSSSLVEEELLFYLKNKVNNLFYITHPFKGARDNLKLNTNVDYYINGRLKKNNIGSSGFGPEILFFLKDFFFNLKFFLTNEKIDIFFGVDNLNAFSGILLRKFGKVDKVIYYVIDYVPQRFDNPVINKIYNWVDIYCVKNADQTWNLSNDMAKARQKKGLNKKYLKVQKTVPVGCNPKNNKFLVENKIVFLGIISDEQGVGLLIKALPKVIKSIPDVKLIIIGSGKELEDIKQSAKKINIANSIVFRGFIKDSKKVEKILLNNSIGVAPYLLTNNSFKYYTDPGKIKTYLGAGLPVVMTNISHIAKVIKNKNAGIIISDDQIELSDAIIKLLTDKIFYSKVKKNAIDLSRQYAWKNIYNKAFKELN